MIQLELASWLTGRRMQLSREREQAVDGRCVGHSSILVDSVRGGLLLMDASLLHTVLLEPGYLSR